MAPDYARFARQIALPELGAVGQARLGEVPVRFEPPLPIAASLHERAGGSIDREGGFAVRVTTNVAPEGPAREGVAAWWAVEAARRVLGEAECQPSPALLARLGVAPAG